MEKRKEDLWWKPGISEKEKEETKKKIAETAMAYEDLAVKITQLKKKYEQLEKEDFEINNIMQSSIDVIRMAGTSDKSEDIAIVEAVKEDKEKMRERRKELEPLILDLEDEIKEKKEQLKSMPRIGKDTDYHILLGYDTEDELAPFKEKLTEAKKELNLIVKVIETLTQRVEEKKKELDKYLQKPAEEKIQAEIEHRKSMIKHFKKTLEIKGKEQEKIANFYLDLKNKLDKLESKQPNIQ